MPVSRQLLTTLIRGFAQGAIDSNDQKYGRQLATICEQAAVTLRLKFGGASLLLAARAAKAPNGKPPPKIVGDHAPAERRALPPEMALAVLKIAAASLTPSGEYDVIRRALGVESPDAAPIVRIVHQARMNGTPIQLGDFTCAAWPVGHPKHVPIDNLQTGVQS